MIYNKKVGGEIAFKKDDNYNYITDSGRSSLRIILTKLRKKKFLIPDFLCEIIVDIFKEKKIKFEYYSVDQNLNIKISSNKKFDVLYIINFFGNKINRQNKYEKKIIIEDNVFLAYFDNSKKYKRWIGFNSLRKVTPMVDGSVIKTTLRLDHNLITRQESTFVTYKTKALNLKYAQNELQISNEKKYLSLINYGENILNKQKKSYVMSNQSILDYSKFSLNFTKEKKIRKINFDALKSFLQKYSIKIKTEFYSFFPLLVENKTKIIKELFKHKIFLPSYYPKFNDLENNLYNSLLCIPVDSRYNKKDMNKVAKILLKTIKKYEK